MIPLHERPTPLTDAAARAEMAMSSIEPGWYVHSAFACDLEQKLDLCREALEQISKYAKSNDFMPEVARAALSATEPKL